MDAAYALDAQGGLNAKGKAVEVGRLATVSGQTRRTAELPKAKDMSHHLNRIARNRNPSSLKELYKYAAMPGMISMGGGIPHPDIFPFEEISALTLPIDAVSLDLPRVPDEPKKGFMAWLFGTGGKRVDEITIPKYAKNPTPTTVQLSTSLQYQAATGPPALPLFLREYVEKVYRPAYADWDVLLTVGATDGWAKICQLLLEMGDAILVEEWTYPGAENAFLPLECEMVPIKMDGEGVIPSYLEEVLGGWDEAKRGGKKRPKVFYTVPTGQNPTGATMMGKRKKEVYEVCQKYDVIICEDEPYYTLYVGDWLPRDHQPTTEEQNQIDTEKKEGKEGNEAFIKALPPTYLTFDTDGRVIRMDTFSKTSCPGSRLGWITTSPLFLERIMRETEAQTQAPSGFATALTTSLLTHWGFEGYIRWLRGIKATYKQRRDWMCDAFQDNFHLELDGRGSGGGGEGLEEKMAVLDIAGLGKGVTCYAKELAGDRWSEKKGVMSQKKGQALVSFIPPTAGMFIFLAIHISHHPSYPSLLSSGQSPAEITAKLMDQLWHDLAEHHVLVAPGWGFDARGVHNIGGDGIGYFRLSFSTLNYAQTRTAVKVLAEVLGKFFEKK